MTHPIETIELDDVPQLLKDMGSNLTLHDFSGGKTFVVVPDASMTTSGSYLNSSMLSLDYVASDGKVLPFVVEISTFSKYKVAQNSQLFLQKQDVLDFIRRAEEQAATYEASLV